MGDSTSPLVDRVYSTINVKSFDDVTGRRFSGVASTPRTDRVGDVVEPLGAQFQNPLPLLLFHDSQQPVGLIHWGKPTKDGIPFTAEIPEVKEDGEVKRLTDKAAHFVKYRLIRAVSIGFKPLEEAVEVIKTGLRFVKWEGLETSLVPIPANTDAVINGATIKSFDRFSNLSQFDTEPAALGTSAPDSSIRSGVTDATRVVQIAPQKAKTMKSVAEQKQSFAETREAKAARMNEIMQKAADAGVTLDAAQSEEYDTLDAEIKGIDAHLARLDVLEKSNIAKAVPAAGGSTKDATASRGGETNVIQVNDKLPIGMGFARAVKAQLVAKLDNKNPLDVAKQMYPSDARLHKHLAHVQALPNIIMQLKAAVPAATTTESTWASALVDPTNLPGEFIEFLRPETIIGRLNLRGIPTNVRLIEQTQGGTGYWVGQGAPKPLTSFGYAPVTLSPTKVAAIAVATKESLRYSTPSLDMLIRDGLRDALVQRVDEDLLDPTQAGSANVQPASLTSGVTPQTSSGTSADNVRTDIANLVQSLRSAHLRGPIAVVLPDALLTAMAFMVNSLGQPEFPGLDNDGGTYKGIRFIGSEYMANASGAGNMVVAIAEREVFVSNDGGVTIDASDQASLQMLNNPTNNSATATPTTMVSMFQTNSVAFLGEWHINWQKRRSTAVAYLDDVNWGSIGSPS